MANSRTHVRNGSAKNSVPNFLQAQKTGNVSPHAKTSGGVSTRASVEDIAAPIPPGVVQGSVPNTNVNSFPDTTSGNIAAVPPDIVHNSMVDVRSGDMLDHRMHATLSNDSTQGLGNAYSDSTISGSIVNVISDSSLDQVPDSISSSAIYGSTENTKSDYSSQHGLDRISSNALQGTVVSVTLDDFSENNSDKISSNFMHGSTEDRTSDYSSGQASASIPGSSSSATSNYLSEQRLNKISSNSVYGSLGSTKSEYQSGQVSASVPDSMHDSTSSTTSNYLLGQSSDTISSNAMYKSPGDTKSDYLTGQASDNVAPDSMHGSTSSTTSNYFSEQSSEPISSDAMLGSDDVDKLASSSSGQELASQMSSDLLQDSTFNEAQNGLSVYGSQNYSIKKNLDNSPNQGSYNNATTNASAILPDKELETNLLDSTNGSTQEESIQASLDFGTLDSANSTASSTTTSSSTAKKNPRKFVSYTSSRWEEIWLANIDDWQKSESICDVMLSPEHVKFMYDFLKSTCTNGFQDPYSNWCMIDDEMHPMYFNTDNHDKIEFHWDATEYPNTFWSGPEDITLVSDGEPTRVIRPTSDVEHVFSKFVFLDETTGEEYVEYIEPLVSHLRFPLSKCEEDDKTSRWYQILYSRGLEYRGYVVPPAGVRNERKLYFDAGASNWSKISKGSSLQYFYNMWKRQGIEWDHIFAYEMTTSPDEFWETVPEEHRELITYRQCAVSSAPQQQQQQQQQEDNSNHNIINNNSKEEEEEEEHPFLPYEIRRHAKAEDYVLFKLDIDSYGIEVGTIEYIINDPDNFIDEVVFEHHVSGNYLMRPEWGDTIAGSGEEVSLLESYQLFLAMRRKGIRSHSWV